MQDILEALIDALLSKKDAMPFMLRYFLKILYQECMIKYREEYGEQKILTLLSDFFISRWIVPACFVDIGQNGLSKEFYLE